MKKKVHRSIKTLILTVVFVLLVGGGGIATWAENNISINISSHTINIGDEENPLILWINNLPEGKKTKWVSWNENIATVDQEGEKGVVTALRKGKTIISSGIGFPRETCLVTVVEPSIKLNKTSAVIYCAPTKENTKAVSSGDTIQLKAMVKGADKNTLWSSSNKAVATVDTTGKVTSVSAGTANITATANGKSTVCKVTVKDNALSLNLNEMQLSTKGTGSSIKLVPVIVGATKKVTWTTSDATIATVKGGKVTGKKTGEADITATANGVSAKCHVKVEEGLISINEEHVQLYMTKNNTAETKQLKTNASKTDTVVWSSSDEKIATVDSKGMVLAKGAGTAIITAVCDGKADTCMVKVTDTATSIAERIVHLKTKGTAKTYTLDCRVTGRKNAVKWKSSDTKVASISKGKITAKKPGTAIITAEANGVTDKVLVTVQEFTPSITLNQSEYMLYTKGKGNTVTIKAVVDGTNKKVVWDSSNRDVAEVNAKGKVTAKKAGRTLITAKANDVTAKCWVRVKESKVTLEKKYYLLNVGDTEVLAADVIGASQSITYKSSNTKAVGIKKGVITAKKDGSATITVTANGIKEECYVVVTDCKEHDWKLAEGAEKEKEDIVATCEERGLTTYICTKCNGKKQEIVEPLGHQFGRWTVTVKATENAAGLERQICKRCDVENTRSIPAKGKSDIAEAYKLVWEDEFDGDKLNLNDWNFEYHEPGWVNAELQEYVDSEKNTYVKDGKLYIQALKEIRDGKAYYTSGRINTKGKKNYQYGRFEVRAKVPSGKGFLPAFWMMPEDESYYGQWPKCGEIDVMEVHGSALSTTYGTLHFGEPHTQKQGSYTLAEEQPNFGQDFHIFACEWDPDEFRFYVDDVLFYTVNDWFTQKPGFGKVAYPAPYDQPFYMILNLAVGGSWVGYPDEDDKFEENAQFVIDYVRVYQKDNYDTDVDKPENEVKLRDPDETGNYIVNGDFAKVEDLTKEDSNWQILFANGGAATAEIFDNALHITSTNAGTVNYGVQVVQANLPMENGAKYKLTYDAYAEEARTMITGISAPDRGYIRYLEDKTVNLTTEKQTYEHIFDMTADSDANGRVEFNLGNQGSIAKVHISNVRLAKEGDAEKEEKGVLPDGNYVYNGQFNEGNEPGRLRLAYWDWDIRQCKGASVSVTNDSIRELKVVVPESVNGLDNVSVYQEDIAISGKKKYILSFDAYADGNKTIQTTVAGKTFDSALTTDKTSYKYEFETPADLSGSEICFLLGNAGTTYIDNVCVREDCMIVNGDFSNGLLGYEVYVNDAAKVSDYIVDSLNEKDAFSMDITDTGDQDWYIQLKQSGIKLEKDKWYKFSFDAKSTVDREIMYALQRDGTSDDNWTPYSGQPKAALTAGFQTFEKVFQMKSDTDANTILSISMGAVGGKQIAQKHTIVIDNINLEETEAQEEPVEPPVEPGENMIQNGDFEASDAHWVNAVTPPGEAEVSFAEGKAVYHISNVGTEDWNVQLKHAELLTLEQGASYQVQMRIKSTESRTVKYAFLNPAYDWYGGEDLILSANEEKEVDFTLNVEKPTDNEITFVISMGQIKDNETQEFIPTPSSTIEIDDIRVVKISGGGDTPENPDDPITENMIQNGDFANEKENWTDYVDSAAAATTDFIQNKARYEITKAGTADWNVQLKQEGLTMEAGASYKLEMKIGASIDRDVKVAFMGAGDAWHGGTDIRLTKDKLKSVSRIIKLEDKEITGTIAFQISLGQPDGAELAAHAIEISDIRLTKVESGADAGEETETDQIITPPENKEEESNPEDTNMQDKKLDSEEDSNLETDTTSDAEESESATQEEETESTTEEPSETEETESTTEEPSETEETESTTEEVESTEESSETEETESTTEEPSETEETESTEESLETEESENTEESLETEEIESTTEEESLETEESENTEKTSEIEESKRTKESSNK
ncbi:MAG: carbohydrate binding domain-containing protein [Lachnospiraceae bacterium]